MYPLCKNSMFGLFQHKLPGHLHGVSKQFFYGCRCFPDEYRCKELQPICWPAAWLSFSRVFFLQPSEGIFILLASFQTTLSIGPSCPSRSLYTGGTPLIFRIYSLVPNLARYRIIFLSASSQCSPYRRTHRLSSSPTSWWSPAAARRASPARSIWGTG